MEEQKENSINVKYIYLKEIQSKSVLNTLSSKLKSKDFSIIDSEFVALTYVNKNRVIEDGEILLDPSEIKVYEKFYRNLFEEAHEL